MPTVGNERTEDKGILLLYSVGVFGLQKDPLKGLAQLSGRESLTPRGVHLEKRTPKLSRFFLIQSDISSWISRHEANVFGIFICSRKRCK